jgi:hypothetical protein
MVMVMVFMKLEAVVIAATWVVLGSCLTAKMAAAAMTTKAS